MRTVCSVPGCGRKELAKLLCGTHYQRVQKSGSFELARRPSVVERFLSYVIKSAPGGCWDWSGGKSGDKPAKTGAWSRGVFEYQGRTRIAARVSWMLFRGGIPIGQVVCHRCDVPWCVNPDHLFIGTQKDNIQDCISKGRKVCNPRRGEKHRGAILTEAQVLSIRKAHTEGTRQARLALEYGVNYRTINVIVNRKTWKHLGEFAMPDVVEREVKLTLLPALQAEIGRGASLLEFAKEAYPIIDSHEIAECASDDRKNALAVAKALTERRNKYLEPAMLIVERAKGDFNPAIASAEAAARYISDRLIDFTTKENNRISAEKAERDRIERDARAKAEAEAAAARAKAEAEAKEQRRQAEEAERQRKEAEARGDAEAAAKAAEAAAVSKADEAAALEKGEAVAGELILAADAARQPEPTQQSIAGFGTAKNWKAELVLPEEEVMIKIIEVLTGTKYGEWPADRPEFIAYLSLNMDALTKTAKALEGNFKVPGVAARNVPIARTARGKKA